MANRIGYPFNNEWEHFGVNQRQQTKQNQKLNVIQFGFEMDKKRKKNVSVFVAVAFHR